MNYYNLLDSNRDDDINDIKKKFKKKILACHPDKNNKQDTDETYSRQLIEAWIYIKNNHGKESIHTVQNSDDLIPLGFTSRGYDYIPKLGEFIRKEIEKENRMKLEEKNRRLQLQDEESNGFMDIIYNYLFN
jgi:hypothetical protein